MGSWGRTDGTGPAQEADEEHLEQEEGAEEGKGSWEARKQTISRTRSAQLC